MKHNLQVDSFGQYSLLLNEREDFRVRLTECNHTVVLEAGDYPLHTHSVYEIMLPEKGPYACLLDGVRLTLHPGELLLVQPGQVHEDHMMEGSTWFAFHFQMIPDERFLYAGRVFRDGVLPAQQIIRTEGMGLEALIGLLVHENAPGSMGSFRLNNALFKVIFRKILARFAGPLLQEPFQQQILMEHDAARLAALFRRNVHEMPSLEDLCRQSAMSRSSLHRLCQRLYGLPPCRAFMRFKMLHAKAHIQGDPTVRVKELSRLFGFKTQAHFSWAFHKELGVYPQQLMGRMRGLHPATTL